MKIFKYSAFLLTLLFIYPACKAPITKVGNGNLKSKSIDQLIAKVVSNDMETTFLSLKSKINYSGENQRLSFSADIRIEGEEKVWISAKKFGFEAGRLLIENDSLIILNRLERTYSVIELEELLEIGGVDLGVKVLVDMFRGNPVFLGGKLEGIRQDQQFVIQSKEQSYAINYVFDADRFKMQALTIGDTQSEDQLNMIQSEWEKVLDDKLFPYSRVFELNVASIGSISVEADITKAEFNQPKSMPFSIPKSYTKIDLL